LDKLDAWNEKRSQIAQRYIDELSDVEQISLPSSPDWAGSVWHLFVIRHQHRDAFQEKLKAEGVQTLIHYPIPPHASQAYATLNYSEPDFPVAMQLAQSVLSLPLHPYLDDQQVDLVISAVRAAAAA
jgi:dTDP-4-amino-4,6-dideoxygalactose transaminase